MAAEPSFSAESWRLTVAAHDRVAKWCVVHDDQWPDDELCCFTAHDGRPCAPPTSPSHPHVSGSSVDNGPDHHWPD